MTTLTLHLETRCSPGELYEGLCDSGAFPAMAEEIVSVEPDGDVSRWKVAFRGKHVRWTQREIRHPAAHKICFEQIDGDFVSMSGTWRVEELGAGVVVAFQLEFRTSVPHLAGAIDPMIGRVLLRAAHAVVVGLAGAAEVVTSSPSLTDPVPLPA
jgi:ribosome-associated toxin RatA of RatAB toxin-antitoxin module